MITVRLVLAVLVVGLTALDGLAGLFSSLTIAATVELVARWVSVSRPVGIPAWPLGAGFHWFTGRAVRGTAEPEQASYRRVYNEVSRGQHSRWEYDHGLRSRLQKVLAVRLVERQGIDLDRQPERARDLIGADLWPLVDPNNPTTTDRDETGVPAADLTTLVRRLEQL